MLKVDTDGFDYDVIKSTREGILSNSEPIFPILGNEITEDFQINGYNGLYSLLDIKGYKYVYIFDNYGNMITESKTILKYSENINSYMSKYSEI